jgi:hypothetical protein
MPEDDAGRAGERTEPLARALNELGPELDGIMKGNIHLAGPYGSTQVWAKVAARMALVVLESAKLAESLVTDVAKSISDF